MRFKEKSMPFNDLFFSFYTHLPNISTLKKTVKIKLLFPLENQ